MTERELAAPGEIAWVDVQTTDLQGAKRFYGELLGWSFPETGDPSKEFYVNAELGGRYVAGLASLNPGSPFPIAWSVYFATDSADEFAITVQAAGGTIVVPATDVMEQGRMAFFNDPTGAPFGCWQPKNHKGAGIVSAPGAMTWHEVYTRDAAVTRPFYAKVLGAEVEKMETPGIEYWTLALGRKTIGGLMQMTDAMPADEPSHWNTYFAVSDVDASSARVTELGGQVKQPPFDTPYGRMSLVADPFGAAFCLITPPGA